MTRTEIVKSIAETYDLPVMVVDKVISSFFSAASLSLAVGEDVMIRGFGKLEPITRQGGQRRNPKTGEQVQVPDRRTVAFRPATTLKRKLNRG